MKTRAIALQLIAEKSKISKKMMSEIVCKAVGKMNKNCEE